MEWNQLKDHYKAQWLSIFANNDGDIYIRPDYIGYKKDNIEVYGIIRYPLLTFNDDVLIKYNNRYFKLLLFQREYTKDAYDKISAFDVISKKLNGDVSKFVVKTLDDDMIIEDLTSDKLISYVLKYKDVLDNVYGKLRMLKECSSTHQITTPK